MVKMQVEILAESYDKTEAKVKDLVVREHGEEKLSLTLNGHSVVVRKDDLYKACSAF